jgi:hypothetical protein
LVAQDPSALANKLYAADFGKMTDLQVGTAIVANLGMSALTGLDAFVAAQLTAAGAANKGAKIVSMLNDFSAMTADTTYGTYATAFNTKVDTSLAASQTTGKAEAKFSAAAPTVTSFTLTTGVDAIVGSAGDDTITAPATVAATGVAQTTINSGDSIDGGAGTDSLTLTLAAANNNSLSGLTIKGVENITYVGLDNLASGNADAVAAAAAKVVTAATLAAAVAAKVAADAADTAQGLVVTAATTVAGLSVAAAESTTAFVATTGAKALADAAIATGTTDAQKAAGKAASAALLSVTGVALTTDFAVATRADTLLTDATNLKAATATAAGAGATGAGAAETAAYLADVNAGTKATATKALVGSVTLAANADATSITIDGLSTTVSGLTDLQTVTMAGAIANTASYAATATAAKVSLSSASGTLTVTGSTPLATATVSGSLKQGTATTTAGAGPGSITLVDGATTDTIKTLKLGITNNGTATISGMTAVTAIDAAASTGGLTLAPLAGTLNVTTGAGDDTVTFIAATDIADAAKLTSSLSTGAGKDTITVNVTGSGTSSVNAGAGDDTITMTSAVGSAVVDGGDGKDTVKVGTTTFSTGAYNSLKANVLNVEVLSLTGAAATLDAAKAAQFTEYSVSGAASVITKVADTQTVNVTATSANVTAAGYVGKGVLVDGTGATSTTYAGSLKATAKGAAVALTANASDLTLTVSTVGSTSNGVTTNTATAVTLTGDVKTAVITVNSSTNNSKLTGSDIASSVSLSPANTGLTAAVTDVTVGGASTSLANLASVTLSGTGSATIVNTGTGSKLATIDASGLNGKLLFATGTTPGSLVGDASAGLSFTAGTLAENVKLGSALDTLTYATTSSTYAKMDSITGYSAVANAAGDRVAALSDNITGGIAGTFFARTTGVSGSLDAALTTVGALTASANYVFQNGGNTYIYQDLGAAGLDDADVVIELVGLVNLDVLIADLAA